MEDIFEQQNEKAVALQQAISNFKKSPTERKTLAYLQRKLEEFNKEWDHFNQVDKKIRNANPAVPEDHEYFTRRLYEAVGEKYNEVVTRIDNEIRILNTKALDEKLSAQDDAGKNNKKAAGPEKPSLCQKQRKIIETVQKLTVELINDRTVRSTEYYQLKLKTLDQHWALVQQLHEKLWATVDDYDYDQFILEEEKYHQSILSIQERMHKLSFSSELSKGSNVSSTSVSTMKLPKIELPNFDGDYVKWRQFRDLFTKMVHNQPLPQCQKLCYLQSSLKGEAAKLVQHFTATTDNYEDAWQVINKRYENKRILVDAMLNRLLSQKTTQAESSSTVKSLHDTTQECLLGLNNLGIATETWDAMLIHLLAKLLDRTTRRLWERSLDDPREIPTIKGFLTFLEFHFESEEVMGPEKRGLRHTSSTLIATNMHCNICGQSHGLYHCSKFLSMSSKDRLQLVQGSKLCVNCLKADHKAKQCPTIKNCNICKKRHNTLLHLENQGKGAVIRHKNTTSHNEELDNGNKHHTNRVGDIKKTNEIEPSNRPIPASLAVVPYKKPSSVLLSTIEVQIKDDYGRKITCRAILDNGSQINLISQALVKRLGLRPKENYVNIQGIGQTRSHASARVNIEVASCTTGFVARIEAQVLPKIVSNQPNEFINIAKWNIPQNLQLADPSFNTPKEVDLLIGAGLFYSVLSVGQINLGKGIPQLQNTLFGWVFGGEYLNNEVSDQFTCAMCTDDELNTAMEKFWEIEDGSAHENNFTTAEIRCENHFTEHTRQETDGRLSVRLPFHQNPKVLGNSYDIAVQRLMGIERRLAKFPELREQYNKFMCEYQQLGHMEPINVANIEGPHYFLPHHAVIKPDSTTTKVRVVFDASAKTSNNISLNELLHTGPVIQDDVFTIILRFRQPRYVFTADIEKMYRQVWVHKNDRNFQLILWRSDPKEPIKCFQLKTITYGTSCAPYLAIKSLRKLAEDYRHKYPLASDTIEQNFYVDDVLTGSNNIQMAVEQQYQLRELLHSAGLHLRKWCANDQRLLKHIPVEDQEVSLDINNQESDDVKTMGLTWKPREDYFTIKTRAQFTKKVTKRTALADISRMFDPLGFMAPVTIKAKMFMQQLWKLKLDWDAALPQELHTEWVTFRGELDELESIQVPRHIYGHKKPYMQEVHIFADASEKAYGAVCYVRSIAEDKLIIVRFLCAKSRVAPTKQITLPRLELCAAKLAADLIKRIQKDLNMEPKKFHLWTDSTAVLGWIQSESSNFHTFVANRISCIQRITNIHQWHHVPSEENPADILSRGLHPRQLVNNNHWFYGPKFLHSAVDRWNKTTLKVETCSLEKREKLKESIVATLAVNNDEFLAGINHKNSFRRLQRVISYIMRITKPNNPAAKLLGKASQAVRAEEMEDALMRIVRSMQVTYMDEIKYIRKYGAVQHNSSLSHLTPFIDKMGILRVGGRLEAGNLSYDAKHPILLSHLHPLAKLLLLALHKENLHAGVQTLLAISRQRFWIVNGKTLSRSVVHNCVQCTRTKPKLMQQMMGNLPMDRIVPNRPFVVTGVDFFGPIYIHFKSRGKRPQKAYVSVFCCFSTKAIHMEIVSDLTTKAFLGALKRFMGRRGHCQKIYCDNATNFVGAKNCLADLHNSIHSEKAQQKIISMCSPAGIKFEFIPPRAPHFGGLWEAAVKSAKTLMQKTLMSASLTYEEMETVLIEVEAILNSRPITPMSTDPNDMTALTPGHFLIGEPLTSSIDQQAESNNGNLLTRWKLVTHLKSEFWKRWSSEYLQQLQHRYKWKQKNNGITPGMMVIIKEDNLPPLRWPLGRIEKVITGDDGLVRVVDVKTSTTILRRPIHRLAPLLEDEAVQQTKNADIRSDQGKVNQSQGNSRKRPASSNIATLLLTCLMLPFVYSTSVEVKRFEGNPGLYFERIGMANIISTDWNLINYFDLKPYRQDNEIVHKYVHMLTDLCESIHDNASCQKIVTQIQGHVLIIEANNQFLKSDKQLSRNKRGAFNFIGNVANGLFGVLDSEYAEQLSTTIDNMKLNDLTLKSSIENQTSFLDRTISLMKKDQDEVEKEFRQIEKRFHAIAQKINNLVQGLESQHTLTMFNELALLAFLHISKFQKMQEAIIDVLTDAHHGKINPELLTAQELKQELETIKVVNARSLKLPLPTTAIEKYYRIMTISHKITSKYMIFSIKIPLVTATQFEVLKLTAVPWYLNNTFQQINLSTPYLIVDLLRTHYQPFTKDDLQQCLCVDQIQFFCNQNQPLYNQDAKVSNCEINVLKQTGTIEQCRIVTIGQGPFWMALQETNSWIYAIATNTQLDIACNNIPNQLGINGVGILKAGNKCIIKAPYLTLESHETISTTRSVSYVPALDIRIASTRSEKENTTMANYTSRYHPQHEIQSLKNQLAELKAISFNTIRPHDIHHYGLGYILLIIVVTAGAYTCWRVRNKDKEEGPKVPKPEPAPRSTLTDGESRIITMYDS